MDERPKTFTPEQLAVLAYLAHLCQSAKSEQNEKKNF